MTIVNLILVSGVAVALRLEADTNVTVHMDMLVNNVNKLTIVVLIHAIMADIVQIQRAVLHVHVIQVIWEHIAKPLIVAYICSVDMADVITIITTIKPSVIVTMVTLDYFAIQLIIAAQIHAVTMANARIPPQVIDVPVNRDTQVTTVRKTVVKILVVHMGDAQMIAEPTGVLAIADIQEQCVVELLTIAVQIPVCEGNV